MERQASSWHGVELRHLAALETVARERSFSAAADALGYTQSAVSSQITALERIVGARLFERIRGTRGVELTEDEAGLGCGLVPSLALGGDQQGLVARPVERLPARIVGIAWNRERRRTQAVARFADAVRTTAARRVAA